MRKPIRLLAILLIVIFSQQTFADRRENDDRVVVKKAKTIEVTALDTIHGYEKKYVTPNENLNDLFAEKIDSLFNTWYMQNIFQTIPNDSVNDSTKIVSLPDSVYINRLQAIDSYIDLSFNKTVKNFIELYTQRRRGQVEMMLGLANYYFPIFEKILDKYDLPLELEYMPIIESALNPAARSRANAVGLWQFMYGTGKMYKLEISTFVDERRDPVKATEAAVRYLKDLYDIYHDWHLVIAAYNCGPGNVNKAIRRSGGTRNYWSIYYRLPRETRGYVPAFIAAAYVMNYYQQHNLHPRYPDFPIVTDTIMVNSYLNFKQISNVINIPVDELRALNPQYRLDIIPAKKDKPYALKIPIDLVADYIDNEQAIYAYKRDEFFPHNEIINPRSRSSYYPTAVKGKEKVIYRVKHGDNLGYIAEWFHVRASDLRYWNNIHHNLIRVGQKLAVYVPSGQGDFYADVNSMSFAQKQAFKNKKPVTKAYSARDPQITVRGDYVYYTVRRGDNLWSIARKFPGVSNHDIMRWNGMGSGSTIHPGQKLKIKPKS
ncbi:MAG TPA: transglycosylase SLT domain-containing protein [Sunxiuqinia sp.]|nr:transglycosylase SLT domain-containing protein [Sunxiuqinia sp.]